MPEHDHGKLQIELSLAPDIETVYKLVQMHARAHLTDEVTRRTADIVRLVSQLAALSTGMVGNEIDLVDVDPGRRRALDILFADRYELMSFLSSNKEHVGEIDLSRHARSAAGQNGAGEPDPAPPEHMLWLAALILGVAGKESGGWDEARPWVLRV